MSASKASKPVVKPSAVEHDDSAGVDALLAKLDHPLKPLIQAIRKLVMAADPKVTEGVKWNSVSFYAQGWFLTINARKPKQLDLVFHCGAKTQAGCRVKETVKDASNLLQWPSPDRALLALSGMADFDSKRPAVLSIVRTWAKYQQSVAS